MDVLRSCIVCHQLYRNDYRYLVASLRVVDQRISYDGLFRRRPVILYAVKGAARSA